VNGTDSSILDWLLEGDPIIRWQVMRDLLREPEAACRRADRIPHEGWGADFLSHQLPDGSWAPGRWTDTTWMLLLLLDCGVPKQNERLKQAANLRISGLLPPGEPVERRVLRERLDLCHVGFWLRFGSAFMPGDPRLEAMAEVIFELQMADGGWNCHIRNYPNTQHNSFNTTFNVWMELRRRPWTRGRGRSRFQVAKHGRWVHACPRLYKSDKTDSHHEPHATSRFLRIGTTVLQGLDYIRARRTLTTRLRGRRPTPGRQTQAQRTGLLRTASLASRSSTWRSQARRVAGTRFEPCACSNPGRSLYPEGCPTSANRPAAEHHDFATVFDYVRGTGRSRRRRMKWTAALAVCLLLASCQAAGTPSLPGTPSSPPAPSAGTAEAGPSATRAEPAALPICFSPSEILPFAFTADEAGLLVRERTGVQVFNCRQVNSRISLQRH
jgi:hypothetical protein